MAVEPGDAAEFAVSVLRKDLTECMRLLSEIELCNGIDGRASPDDVRIQGGQRLSVEERYIVAHERLGRFHSRVIEVADTLRRAPDSRTARYLDCLLSGKRGAALRKELKMNAAAHERMKRWLVTVLRRAGVAP